MSDLEQRLVDLGDDLDLDDNGALVDALMRRIDERPPATADRSSGSGRGQGRRPAATWLRAAAVVFCVGAVVLVAVPSSRDAIADWLGLNGVRIERDPELTVPATVPQIDNGGASVDGTIVDADGTAVLVGEIDVSSFAGRFEDALLSKSLAEGTRVERVEVGGQGGLWIDGEPHVVSFRSPDGEVVSERFAGNTLLWEDNDVIRRVEGFADRRDAIAFAITLGELDQ